MGGEYMDERKSSRTRPEKATDMEQVRMTAKTFLMLDYQKTSFSPMVVQHPFTSSGIVLVQKDDTAQLVDITESQENFEAWQRFISGEIDQAERAYDIYMMLNKAFALTFLKYAAPYMSTNDFSSILADAWMLSENPNQDVNVSKKELTAMFKAADRNMMMRDCDKELFSSLDDCVTIYRGVTDYNRTNIRALSWTLNYKTAQWFAGRFDQEGTVYQAAINKKDILAVFTGRNESEIIVDPKRLQNIEEVQEQGFDMTMSCF